MDRRTLISKYLSFFESKGHKIIPSSSLYPENDPSALFTSAGMHPLVPYLLGEPHPSGSKRVCDVQKCIRTGDIDEVGDYSHLTFFEMLGNWSLNDYGKKDAISWSYEFITGKKWLNQSIDKLSVTVFEGEGSIQPDNEAAEIWQSLGLPKERIFFLPKSDNWWGPVGNTGPCGPDTEMFFDTGKPKCGSACRPGCHCGKYIEVWNDVFLIYEKQADGSYKLGRKNVDTGMGVERMLSILNGFDNVYQTDIFQPLLQVIQSLTAHTKLLDKNLIRARIIADHIRSAIFMLADPKHIVPSNVEHGYVIRRLIRRSIIKGQELGIEGGFVTKLVPSVLAVFGHDYPELVENKEFVITQLQQEEERFSKTLVKGMRKFEQLLLQKGEITGEDAFMLFTSFGFPLEMTIELLKEKGINLDLVSFQKAFDHHKELSRTATKGHFQSGLTDHSEIVTKLHTATHLTHQALRNVLGNTIQQKGSNITNERSRFDVSFDRKLTPEELAEVERQVNAVVQQNVDVEKAIMSPQEAKENGALGFFEQKYGDQVSVYSIGTFSKEICAGPHVKASGEIGVIKIKKQEKVGANVLRMHIVIEE